MLLAERLPDVLEALLAAGASVMVPEGLPPAAEMLKVRRAVFERVMWEIVSAEPGIQRFTGHVGRVEVEGDRAVGLVVDGRFVGADVVLDAAGRNGRLSDGYRPDGERTECGMAYCSREYELLPGATPGPTNGGPGYVTEHDGFMSFVFASDAGTFMVLLVRRSDDKDLANLRHTHAFEAACRILPGVAEWTDPGRSLPTDVVRAGAGLANAVAPQPNAVRGLLVIGDAFSMTNPQGGRGVTLGMQCAAYAADLLTTKTPEDWGRLLDEWGQDRLRPWYDDHVAWDHTLRRRWAGLPVLPDEPIGVDVLIAAAAVRPQLRAVLGPYFGMVVGPQALGPIREEVRGMIRDGWQPAKPGGVTRHQLVATVQAALPPSESLGMTG
jgi:flavin-dependent dehydrogenase